MPRRLLVGHANGIHDAAIALAEEDAVFAEALERHSQCKRAIDALLLYYSGRAIRHACRELGGWPVCDAEVATIGTWNYDGVAAPGPAAERLGVPTRDPLFDNQVVWTLAGHPPHHVPPAVAAMLGVDLGVRLTRLPGLPHHLAHAATAVYTSPFDECVVLVVDGAGEDLSTSAYHFHDDRFELLHACPIRHSLGILYAAVTSLCGFSSIEGEEWKVMGLAAYGQPNDAIYRYFRDRIQVDGLAVVLADELRLGTAGAFAGLAALTGGFRLATDPRVERAADLAHNFQRAFEDAVADLAEAASASDCRGGWRSPAAAR